MRGKLELAAVLMLAFVVQGAPALAQPDLQGGIQDMVRQIIGGMEQQEKLKLAILDFTKLDGSADNFTRYLTEQLATQMVLTQRNFEVIERKHLDKILAEQGLNLSGVIEPQNVKRVGKLSGIDALATGSVTELPTSLDVNARLIDTETGKVFAVAISRFTKDRDVLALLGREGERKDRETTRPPVVALIPHKESAEESKDTALRVLKNLMSDTNTKMTFDFLLTDCLAVVPTNLLQPTPCVAWVTGTKSSHASFKVFFRDIQRASFEKAGFFGTPKATYCLRAEDVEIHDPHRELKAESLDNLNRSAKKLPGQFCLVIHTRSNEQLEQLRTALETLSGKQLPQID